MNLDEARCKGREMSLTEGSTHYHGKVQPLELIFSLGHGESFCVGNIIKYASRYSLTNRKQDLIKIVDYTTLLLGHFHSD